MLPNGIQGSKVFPQWSRGSKSRNFKVNQYILKMTPAFHLVFWLILHIFKYFILHLIFRNWKSIYSLPNFTISMQGAWLSPFSARTPPSPRAHTVSIIQTYGKLCTYISGFAAGEGNTTCLDTWRWAVEVDIGLPVFIAMYTTTAQL